MPPEPTFDANQTILHRASGGAEPSTVDGTAAYEMTPPEHAPPSHSTWPTIPGYTISAEIARGGMGRVYAAHDTTLNREVAIKTLLPGADADRFVVEARITARLPHPGIPPVHALGAFADGSPYLAMKRVRGETLAAILKTRALADRSRLISVFEQICQAVGFAHSQSVIHRDLKPLNVMVGAFGEVQVMDWGLAKDRTRTEAADRPDPHTDDPDDTKTRAGAVLGTPGYMAPEQARGEPADTRSDVFALGATLAALLTGKPAFVGSTPRETIERAAAADLADVWQRLDACGADAELIQLATTCLAAKPEDRPTDAREVATAISVYRARVEARLREAETAQAETAVRTAEERKRRRVLRIAGALLAAVLVAGTVVSLWQAARAWNAEAAAEQRAEGERLANAETKRQQDLLFSVFRDLDIHEIKAIAEPLESVLAKRLVTAAQQIDPTTARDPLATATVQNQLGSSLSGLGYDAEAIPVLRQAAATFTADLGPAHPDTLEVQLKLAHAHEKLGEFAVAESLLNEIIAQGEAAHGAGDANVVVALTQLIHTQLTAGRPHDAVRTGEDVLARATRQFGDSDQGTLAALGNLASAYREAGMARKAVPICETVLARRRALLGPDHPDTLAALNELGLAHRYAGQPAEAVPVQEELLAHTRSLRGADHPNTITAMSNLASVYIAVGRTKDGVELHEQTVTTSKARLGADHPDTLLAAANLAQAYTDSGRFADAIALNEENLARFRAKFGPAHKLSVEVMQNLALGYLNTNRTAEAVPLFESALAQRKSDLGSQHPDTLRTMNNLATVYQNLRRYPDAIPLLEAALAGKIETLGPEHPSVYIGQNNLADCYREAGRPAEAIPLLETALAGQTAVVGPLHPHTLRSHSNLAICLLANGQSERGVAVFEEYLARAAERLKPDSDPFAGQLTQASSYFMEAKQFAVAEKHLRRALAIRQQVAADSWTRFNTEAMLGAALMGQDKLTDALPLLTSGYEGMRARAKTIPPPAAGRLPAAVDWLIEVHTRLGQPDEVKKWQAARAKFTPAGKL